MAGVPAKAVHKLIGEVNESELAVRILEACMSIQRPAGATAPQALIAAGEAGAMAQAGARAALVYMAECFSNAVRPQ